MSYLTFNGTLVTSRASGSPFLCLPAVDSTAVPFPANLRSTAKTPRASPDVTMLPQEWQEMVRQESPPVAPVVVQPSISPPSPTLAAAQAFQVRAAKEMMRD